MHDGCVGRLIIGGLAKPWIHLGARVSDRSARRGEMQVAITRLHLDLKEWSAFRAFVEVFDSVRRFVYMQWIRLQRLLSLMDS